MDQEYLAFVPRTMLVHILGKSWKWGSARYLHCHVAQDSPIVMMMLLAISANELESRQIAEGSKLRRVNTGVNYYRAALQRFSATLNNQEYQSERGYNEIFAVFFLMLYYEKQFGTDLGGLRAHLRGVHAFLKTNCSTGSTMQGLLDRLPILSKQLLLYITYLHLALLATRDFTLEVWEDTGFDDLAGLDMDQVFRETRNVHSTIWGQEYPAEEIVDDMSVYRPLALYHECNKFKSKMIRVFQGSKSFIDHPISHKALHDELEQIGKPSGLIFRCEDVSYTQAILQWQSTMPFP
ncbi:hypothetical protein N7488_004766 [Penicillium malachiteum]|nr:hypothetical protein N7488_004766 [Penicillium malachiteum]